MNTLFARILLWFVCMLAITVVGSAFISALSMSENDSDRRAPGARMADFQLSMARSAYERGGRAELEKYLAEIRRIFDGEGILTDARGRDLLTGQDRSALVRRAQAQRVDYRPFWVGRALVARAADDGRYWFFLLIPRIRVGLWFLRADHVFAMLVGVLLCYLLALHLTQPLRQLQRAVERFGRGDLCARVKSQRRDELGELARTFDQMAAQTERLVSAERRLLQDISHELRSPLARLGVAIELARSGDDLNAALDRIQKESDRLNDLVTQLLQVTRAEGDPNALRHDRVRLDELVQQLVDDSAIEAKAHDCELKYARRPPATVEGDPELLRRAVENVIRNAIRYAPPHTAIEVSVARNNGNVVVDVRDRGPGVPEEALPRIFDAFYRVGADRVRSGGGVGLGLSIARRAIELHNGSIRARNADPGLEVEMELPAGG